MTGTGIMRVLFDALHYRDGKFPDRTRHANDVNCHLTVDSFEGIAE